MKNLIVSAWNRTVQKNSNTSAYKRSGNKITLTFENINQLSEDYLFRLNNLGSIKKRVVAFRLNNTEHWIAFFLAVQKADAIALPLDKTFPDKYVDSLLDSTNASVYFNGTTFIEKKGMHFKSKTLAIIKLSSGSSGIPKGIFFKDSEIIADAENICRTMNISSGDINYSTLEYPHSYALGNLIIPLILYGIPIIQSSGNYPQLIADELKSSGATVFPTIPHILKAITSLAPDIGKTVRLTISAGANLDTNIAKNYYSVYQKKVHNFYGSSETGAIAYDITGALTLSGAAVGNPIKGVDITVSKSNRFYVSSHAVFSYRNSSKRKFLLPDRGYINNKGEIVLSGRINTHVKIGGRRLSISEIEMSILAIKSVKKSFVFLNKNNHKLYAAYQGSIPSKKISEALSITLSQWKIPKKIIRLNEFPTNARGKIDKVKIEKMLS